jgi:hypothetical protein
MPAQAPETLVDAAALAAPLRLPAELTIYTAAETRTAWLNWLADHPGCSPSTAAGAGTPCAVDASSCDEIDAAGAQLLVALAHSLARLQRRLQLQHASTPVRDACRDLGLADWLLADAPTEVPA